MSSDVLFVAVLVLLPAVGLVFWAGFAMAQVEEELRVFCGLDGLHFEALPSLRDP